MTEENSLLTKLPTIPKKILGFDTTQVAIGVVLLGLTLWALSKSCDTNMLTGDPKEESFYWRGRRNWYSPYSRFNYPYTNSFYYPYYYGGWNYWY